MGDLSRRGAVRGAIAVVAALACAAIVVALVERGPDARSASPRVEFTSATYYLPPPPTYYIAPSPTGYVPTMPNFPTLANATTTTVGVGATTSSTPLTRTAGRGSKKTAAAQATPKTRTSFKTLAIVLLAIALLVGALTGGMRYKANQREQARAGN